MSLKKCVKCGSQWSSALPRCAFCGGEPQEVEVPKVVVKLQSERAAEKAIEEELRAPAEPEPLPEPPAPEAPPEPPPRPPPDPINYTPPAPAEPEPEPESEPEPETRPEPEPAPKKADAPPPVPAGPSAKLPLLFTFAALVGCAALPIAASMPRANLDIFALIAAALLAPLAPAAWVMGARCEHACREARLSTFGSRVARRLGAVLTTLLAIEFAALAGFLAYARIFGHIASPLFSRLVK